MTDLPETPKASSKRIAAPSVVPADGASSLLDLFAPPPINNNSNHNKQQAGDGVSDKKNTTMSNYVSLRPPQILQRPSMTPRSGNGKKMANNLGNQTGGAVSFDALQVTPTFGSNPLEQQQQRNANNDDDHGSDSDDDDDDNDEDGKEGEPQRRSTVVHSNSNRKSTDSSSPVRMARENKLESLFVDPGNGNRSSPINNDCENSFNSPTDQTPLLGGRKHVEDNVSFSEVSYMKPTFTTTSATTIALPSSFKKKKKVDKLHPIDEVPFRDCFSNSLFFKTLLQRTESFCTTFKASLLEFTHPWTWIGGFMFLLYHIVFCLTMGSAVTRPDGEGFPNMLGLFTKMSAGGIIFGSPIMWLLINDIPALYPAADLFAAPFFADMALKVDAAIMADPALQKLSPEENNLVFLSTFSFLAQSSMIITAILLILASVFKLANIGSFLPYSVLAGFFAAVAVLTWDLAWKIDTNGATMSDVFFSGDLTYMKESLIHHIPSVVTAVLMFCLGPKHPFYVMGLILACVGCFYIIMLSFGVSRDKAMESFWFWGLSDLVYAPMNAPFGFRDWDIPAPLGWIKCFLFYKDIHWGAAMRGMDTAIALAFLYLIRCSLHAPALRKNISNLSRPETVVTPPDNDVTNNFGGHSSIVESMRGSFQKRAFSEKFDLEQLKTEDDAGAISNVVMVTAKPTSHSVKEIMAAYGYSTGLCGLLGFLFITPNISISGTMYKLRADKVAPQFLAAALLLVFYLFDFRVVGYIPKTAFSSLLVLAAINNAHTYAFKSYSRTKEKLEWLVVPLIVVLANMVGLLEAVFLGIAISTFIFVASFFRSGVVKFIATGNVIRSTIERPPQSAIWLDENGALIQVLVLQNYLFFGNSSSIMNYVGSMFEEADEDTDSYLLPPLPKIVIMDLTLVSGIDTSAVDIFSEILVVCSSHDCKLFIAGASSSLRVAMQLGGFTAGNLSGPASRRKLRFFADLDTAVGKAEDMLLNEAAIEDQVPYGPLLRGQTGFLRALEQVDRQHKLSYTNSLSELDNQTTRYSLEPGDVLYDQLDVPRGLFFIESGILKVEQSATDTINRTGSKMTFSGNSQQMQSLNALKARSIPIANPHQASGTTMALHQERRDFRVARIGPGWILGTGESLTGVGNPGKYVAVTHAIVHYISFETIEQLEESKPRLILDLYKLLSYLMAKRQSLTINQLATLHSIMSSPALKRPLSRSFRSNA